LAKSPPAREHSAEAACFFRGYQRKHRREIMPQAPQSSTHDVAQALSGINFPADKNGILEHARKNNASQEALQAIENLPADQYTSMADVFKGIGQEKQ
jgi:hypothetical protein